jgi:hypothetical protein
MQGKQRENRKMNNGGEGEGRGTIDEGISYSKCNSIQNR